MPHPMPMLCSLLGFLALATLPVALGCDDSASPTPDGGIDDSGVRDTGMPLECADLTCGLTCEYGLRRGAAGCEICECNATPDRTCAADTDCVLSVDWTDCCQCRTAYNQGTVDGHSCISEADAPRPPGCEQDPSCEGAACRCSFAVRTTCDAGTCVAHDDCAPGQVMDNLDCVAACTAHADCTVAADYGNCCGGCNVMSRERMDGDPCLAERARDTECRPAPGSCDGLGCPSPANDCSMFEQAVCMADGTCALGGADGACPGGSMEMGGVCVPAP